MPLKALIGPIAAATIVTAFWFAAMWRGHQIERQTGKSTWQYEAGFFGYLTALGVFAYFRLDGTGARSLDLFGTALFSEGLGILVVYLLVRAFILDRGRPWRERAMPMFFAVLLTGGMIATVLAT